MPPPPPISLTFSSSFCVSASLASLRCSLRLTVWPLVPTLQAEAGRVALELSTTKLRVEEASLRDALSKLSALNEGLAQDKLALNRVVAQVRGGPVDPPALLPPLLLRDPPEASPGPAQVQPTPPWMPLSLCLVLSLTPSVFSLVV